MRHEVKFTINGQGTQGEAEDSMLLVYYIREQLGLTGTHIGCDTGHCGACTVLLDGKSVKSCMVLAVQANGSNILTVEGLAKNGKLHPLQEAFWENDALECGYCTPGMLMSALALLQKNPNPSEQDIRKGMDGNICRCTGYLNIIKAIEDTARILAKK